MSGETRAPWISGNLSIPSQAMDLIKAHAEQSYPSECCGFIKGPLESPAALTEVMQEQNLADKYHALDPESFPRTSQTYFKLDELRAQRAFEEAQKTGQAIKVIYHSHCDAGAYFSEEDANTFAAHNTLMWPCAFLVVSVIQGKAQDYKLWVHVPGTNRFEESKLVVQ